MVIGTVLKFAVAGFGMRMYQLSVRNLPALEGLHTHFAWSAGMGGIGYWAHFKQLELSDMIERKKGEIIKKREYREELFRQREAALQQEGGGGGGGDDEENNDDGQEKDE